MARNNNNKPKTNNNNNNNNNNNYKNNNNNKENNNDSLNKYLTDHGTSLEELNDLISAKKGYIKYKTISKNKHYTLSITGKYLNKEINEIIKISSYHDIKHLVYNYDEKTDDKTTLIVVPGIKNCNERQDYFDQFQTNEDGKSPKQVSDEPLSYFLIFEIERNGKETQIFEGVWRNAFKKVDSDLIPIPDHIVFIGNVNDKKNKKEKLIKRELEKSKKTNTSITSLDHTTTTTTTTSHKTKLTDLEMINIESETGKLYNNLQIRLVSQNFPKSLFQINFHLKGSKKPTENKNKETAAPPDKNEAEKREIKERKLTYREIETVLDSLTQKKIKLDKDFKDKSYILENIKNKYLLLHYEEKENDELDQLKKQIKLDEDEIKKLNDEIKEIKTYIIDLDKKYFNKSKLIEEMKKSWQTYERVYNETRNQIGSLPLLQYKSFYDQIKQILDENMKKLGFDNILKFDAICY